MENILTTQGIKQAFPIGSGREFVALHDINIQIPKGKTYDAPRTFRIR